ncbi:MAG: leucine-rich repeat protein [Clostridia bacterium]|nr:leucine-rich repeat protein [Clostridia bacterium]
MNKTIKRTLCVLLSMALMLSAFGGLGFGVSAAVYDNYFLYSVANGEVTITGHDHALGDVLETRESLVIPAEINGYPVTCIGDRAFSSCICYSSVIIPNSVKRIGNGAFYQNAIRSDVTIPDGVLSIGAGAFAKSPTLPRVTIPDSVTDIGEYVFSECESLTDVSIGDGVTSIPEEAFSDCTSLESVSVGSGVTSIGTAAFDNCKKLTNITLPDNLTSIGERAFDVCESLANFTIPDSVTSIGKDAFAACDSLTSIAIPDGVTEILEGTFKLCDSLSAVTIPNSVTSIGIAAFAWCRSLESITIPNSVTSVREQAFFGCSALESAVIPYGITAIKYDTFYKCTNLKTVHIPSTVTEIGRDAFGLCGSLESVCSDKEDCYAKTFADARNIAFRVCGGHDAASAAGGQVKTLAVGERYLIGDVIYFENVTTFPHESETYVTVHSTQWLRGMINLSREDMVALPEPVYHTPPVHPTSGYENGTWVFDPAFGNAGGESIVDKYKIFVPVQSITKVPVGVKCVSGNGSNESPYRFEAIYSAADSWTWTFSASGNTITATCSGPDAIEPQTLTLNDGVRQYAYNEPLSPSVTASDGWTAENNLPTPSFTYFSSQYMYDGANQGLPGDYTVTMTVGGVSVQANYSITARQASDIVFTPPAPIRNLVCTGESITLFTPGSVSTGDCEMYYKRYYLSYDPNQYYDDYTETVRRDFESAGVLGFYAGGQYDGYIGDEFNRWEYGASPQLSEQLSGYIAGYYVIGYAVRHAYDGYENAYGYIVVKVDKGVPAHTDPPDVLDVTYGQRFADVTLPEGWRFTRNPYGTVDRSDTFYENIRFEVLDEYASHMFADIDHAVLLRSAKKTLTITADPIVKTVGEVDPELTYTVDGLVAGDTLTGALARTGGEEAGTYEVTLGTLSAGKNYDIQFVGSTFTVKKPSEPQDMQSVTIDAQISVNFLLDLDARDNVQSVRIEYIDPATDTVQSDVEYTDFSNMEKQNDLYKIRAKIAPAQLGNTVQATVLYGDGKSETLGTSVAQYCSNLLQSDVGSDAVRALAYAMLEYGQAANEYFGYNDAPIGTTANAERDVAYVKDLPSTLTLKTDKITGAAFVALTKPEFRFFTEGLTEAEAAGLNDRIAVSGNAQARFVKNGDAIILEVTGVEAADMAESVTITVDGAEWVTFTGNDFARLLANYEPTAVLGAALYNYGAAAAACFNG